MTAPHLCECRREDKGQARVDSTDVMFWTRKKNPTFKKILSFIIALIMPLILPFSRQLWSLARSNRTSVCRAYPPWSVWPRPSLASRSKPPAFCWCWLRIVEPSWPASTVRFPRSSVSHATYCRCPLRCAPDRRWSLARIGHEFRGSSSVVGFATPEEKLKIRMTQSVIQHSQSRSNIRKARQLRAFSQPLMGIVMLACPNHDRLIVGRCAGRSTATTAFTKAPAATFALQSFPIKFRYSVVVFKQNLMPSCRISVANGMLNIQRHSVISCDTASLRYSHKSAKF